MKKLRLPVLLILLATAVSPSLQAQVPATTDTLKKESEIVIPPLMDLIDSAIKRNATMRYRNTDIQLRASNLETEKIYWTRNMGFIADTRYGNFNNFSTTDNGQGPIGYYSTNKQFNYSGGFYIKLPLGDVLNRKHQVKQATLQLEEAKDLAEAQAEQVRQNVIRLYQDLLFRQKMMNLRSLALGNARVNGDMIEKEFRNGVIPVVEYVRVSDIVTRAEAEYESAKTDFITAKLILEDVVGFRFTNNSRK